MSLRLQYSTESKQLAHKLFELNMALNESGLDKILIDLVFLRASQLNGCAFCVDMHVKEAKIHGERDLRLHHVPVWRESTLFSAQEKAALEWTEQVTKITPEGVSDEVFERMKKNFSEKEISDLTFAVGIINVWNRLAITFRQVPGSLDKIYGLDKAGLN